MKIDFDLTEQDYIDFQLFFLRTSPQVRKRIVILRVLFAAASIVAGLLSYDRDKPLSVFAVTMAVAIIVAIFFVVGIPQLHEISSIRIIKKTLKDQRNNLLGHYVMTLGTDKLYSTSTTVESSFAYETFIDMKLSDRAIYLFSGPTNAVIIPFHAFSSEKEKHEVIAFLQSKLHH